MSEEETDDEVIGGVRVKNPVPDEETDEEHIGWYRGEAPVSDQETKQLLHSILWAVRYLCVVLFIVMVMVGFGLMAFLLRG